MLDRSSPFSGTIHDTRRAHSSSYHVTLLSNAINQSMSFQCTILISTHSQSILLCTLKSWGEVSTARHTPPKRSIAMRSHMTTATITSHSPSLSHSMKMRDPRSSAHQATTRTYAEVFRTLLRRSYGDTRPNTSINRSDTGPATQQRSPKPHSDSPRPVLQPPER